MHEILKEDIQKLNLRIAEMNEAVNNIDKLTPEHVYALSLDVKQAYNAVGHIIGDIKYIKHRQKLGE